MKTLKYGSKGEQVSQLQHLLISHGAKIAKDGDFGEMTEKAVIAYQKSANLIADGIVGAKTWRSLRGNAAANPITQADYDAAAKRLDVPVNVIRAFAKVESNGSGFFADGRPAILFERHVFYRLLKSKRGKVLADRYASSHPNIVNAKTGGYKGGTSEWVRLQFALTIDADCAYQSASWGAFQIMGRTGRTWAMSLLMTSWGKCMLVKAIILMRFYDSVKQKEACSMRYEKRIGIRCSRYIMAEITKKWATTLNFCVS